VVPDPHVVKYGDNGHGIYIQRAGGYITDVPYSFTVHIFRERNLALTIIYQ